MPRRTRRRRRAPSTGTQVAQIFGLLVILVIILMFRTKIAENAGKFLNAFGDSEDVRVETDEGKARIPVAPEAGEESED